MGRKALPAILLVNDHAQEPVLADVVPHGLRQVLKGGGGAREEAGRTNMTPKTLYLIRVVCDTKRRTATGH